MTVFACAPGVRVEAIGNSWIAFSALSGDTLILNDESAAILEVLAQGPTDTGAIAALLAADAGLPVGDLAATLSASWTSLVTAGLVREVGPPGG